MKLRDFDYVKDDGTKKGYSLLIIKEDVSSMEGISMRDLKEDEKASLIELYKDFEEKLKPFMKNYRKFIKAKMITEIKE